MESGRLHPVDARLGQSHAHASQASIAAAPIHLVQATHGHSSVRNALRKATRKHSGAASIKLAVLHHKREVGSVTLQISQAELNCDPLTLPSFFHSPGPNPTATHTQPNKTD